MRKRKVLQAIKYSSLNSFKYHSTHFWFHSIKEKSNEKITSTRQVWKGGIEKWLAADVSNLKLNPNINILIAHLIESKIYFHVSTIRIVDRLIKWLFKHYTNHKSFCLNRYVRCIKPNMRKAPDDYDAKLVLDQLKYLGMLEIIKIRKQGFPVHHEYKDFLQRYHCLIPKNKRLPNDNKQAAK